MEQKKLDFKQIDEVFTCDCNTRDHCLTATIMDDSMAVLEMVDETLLNIPFTWRLWRSLKIFWAAFWYRDHRIEIVLNRQEQKKWKAFFSNLKDERCWNCEPDYLSGRDYWKHGHAERPNV